MAFQKIKLIGAWLKQYWFRVALLALFVLFFYEKDLSFQVQFNAPDRKEQSVVKERESALTERKVKKTAMIEDHAELNIFGTPGQVSRWQMLNNIKEEDKISFIKRFAYVSVGERKKFGIPSSVILGNALLQSVAGTHPSAISANNFFGLTCEQKWDGDEFQSAHGCFRKYDNAWLSFRDHSVSMTSGKSQKLLKYGPEDYQSWAVGLEQLGFSSERDYANRLVYLIEEFHLAELDKR